jgi:hypothetical protein
LIADLPPQLIEPSLGDLEQFGLLFFARNLFRGSQSLRAIPTIFVSFAAHAIAAATFLDQQGLRAGMLMA